MSATLAERSAWPTQEGLKEAPVTSTGKTGSCIQLPWLYHRAGQTAPGPGSLKRCPLLGKAAAEQQSEVAGTNSFALRRGLRGGSLSQVAKESKAAKKEMMLDRQCWAGLWAILQSPYMHGAYFFLPSPLLLLTAPGAIRQPEAAATKGSSKVAWTKNLQLSTLNCTNVQLTLLLQHSGASFSAFVSQSWIWVKWFLSFYHAEMFSFLRHFCLWLDISTVLISPLFHMKPAE